MPTLSFKVPDDWPGLEFLSAAEKNGWTRSDLLRHIVNEFLEKHGVDVPKTPEPKEQSGALDTKALTIAISDGIVDGIKKAKIGNKIVKSIKTGLKDASLPIAISDGGHANQSEAVLLEPPLKAKRPTPRTTIDEPIEIVDTSEDDLDKASNNFLSMFG